MDSQRETLFAQVKVDLEAIDGEAPYSVRVAEVSRDNKRVEQLKLPAICMVEQGEREERTASGQRIFLLASLSLVLYLPVSSGRPPRPVAQQLNDFLADVKRAMIGTDPTTGIGFGTHNANCFRTIFKAWDPFAVEDGPIATGIVDFDLHYAHGWDTM